MGDSTEKFLDECTSCGHCTEACPFLTEYGTPDDIIKNQPEAAFLCTNCTACDRLCPMEIKPCEALFQTKIRLIRSGEVPESAARAIRAAKSFAERGHKTPFVRYDPEETVFWPGCSLAGTSPEVVKRTVKLLTELLKVRVGLVLDCCFDPLYQMGDLDPLKGACGRIQERLDNGGIRHLIVGCANCRKVFSHFPLTQKVDYVLEILPEDIIGDLPEGDPFIHHPCPFYRIEGVPEKAKMMIQSAQDRMPEPDDKTGIVDDDLPVVFSGRSEKVDEPALPSCCGYGGSINSQDPELAGKFTEKVTAESMGSYIVTSCMGCVNRFLGKKHETYHILELVTGADPVRKPVSSLKRWANRLGLARGNKTGRRQNSGGGLKTRG